MTRENKLALVVGFGLILLVGILISDHFSTARSQEAAKLTEVLDPLVEQQLENPDLIAVREAVTPIPRDPLAPGPHGGGDDRVTIGQPMIVHNGLDPDETTQLPYVFHEVRNGESLSAICGLRYGDRSLAHKLALYNELANPDLVRAGYRLRIPSPDDLVRGRLRPTVPVNRGAPPPIAEAGAGSTSAPDETYTVRKGDVLTRIASRFLGSSSKYKAIFEHNRDQLDSPDDIREGMRLKIPRNAY